MTDKVSDNIDAIEDTEGKLEWTTPELKVTLSVKDTKGGNFAFSAGDDGFYVS
jgi:hypothetical protein